MMATDIERTRLAVATAAEAYGTLTVGVPQLDPVWAGGVGTAATFPKRATLLMEVVPVKPYPQVHQAIRLPEFPGVVVADC